MEFKYGVRNYRMHTVSHCDCDRRFKRCLHDLNDTISTIVGITFFNLFEVPCFTMEEREGCQAWHWWGGCKEYGFTPFAVLQRQGHYNYTHPFSDALDQQSEVCNTTECSNVSPAGSAELQVLPRRRSKDGSLRLDRKQRKKGRLQKSHRRQGKKHRTGAAGVPTAVPLHGLELAITGTGSIHLITEDLMVTDYVASQLPKLMEDPVKKLIEVSFPEGTKIPMPEVMNIPQPSTTEEPIHMVTDIRPYVQNSSFVAEMTEISLTEVMEVVPSELFSNYLEEQKIIALEPLHDQTTTAHPNTYQNSTAQSTTDQPSIDKTSMVPSTESQPSTDQSILEQPISNQNETSWPIKDQSIITTPTDQPSTRTSGTIHGYPSMVQLNVNPVTPPIQIHSSSDRPSLAMSITRTIQWFQETSLVTGGISTSFNVGNLFGKQAAHEQIATDSMKNYVDTLTIPPAIPSTTIRGTQDPGFPATGAGFHVGPDVGGAASVLLKEDQNDNQSNVSLNRTEETLQGMPRFTPPHITVHHPSAVKYLPDRDKSNHHYLSKSCGCYRRLDQCEYKIGPNEEKFQLHNVNQKTLYHCNCTRRLARFLQRKTRPNEVQEVLADFVAPSCFVLKVQEVCSHGKSCRGVPVAVLAASGHLKRTFRLLQKSGKGWAQLERGHPKWEYDEEHGGLVKSGASLKVKRQELKGSGATPEPVRLYEQCLQRVGTTKRQQENPRT